MRTRMTAILTMPNGEQMRLDCPDNRPDLLGEWLKSHFTDMQLKHPYIPIRFTLEIS